MIVAFDSIADAIRAIDDFLYDRPAALPDHLRDAMRDARGVGVSPVQALAETVERGYAIRQDLPEEFRALAAGLADLCATYGFWQMGGGRGFAMAAAFRRGGVEEDDPAPLPEYAPEGDD